MLQPQNMWCQGVLNGVKDGKWKALVERTDEDPLWGSRIKELITYHESYDIEHLSDAEVEECGFTVGVDSGQAGIFDFNTYRNDQIAEGFARTKEPGDAWYDMCCKRTLSDHQCGTVSAASLPMQDTAMVCIRRGTSVTIDTKS